MTERRRPSLDAVPADPLLRALAFRVARLEERLDAVASSLDRLWNVFERRAGRIAPPPPAPAPTPPRSLDVFRVSASTAAQMIGCDTRTVRRLVTSGRLRGSAIRLAGGGRRHWMVEKAAVERLLGATGGSPAAPAASKPRVSSKRRTGDARMTP